MFNANQHLEKSRLGRLLVNRGYVTESQLEMALVEQRQTGRKLGEVLIAQGLISERNLSRTLRHQTRYRYAAAFVAMAVAPLQPAFALGANPVQQTATDVAAEQMLQAQRKGLQPLDEGEMSGVSAQGLYQDLQALANWTPQGDDRADAGLDTVLTLAKAFSPVWEVLDANVVIEGVHYDGRDPSVTVTGDGGFKLAMPTLVESVRYEDIRPAGASGPTFGTISLTNLRFNDNFSLVLRGR